MKAYKISKLSGGAYSVLLVITLLTSTMLAYSLSNALRAPQPTEQQFTPHSYREPIQGSLSGRESLPTPSRSFEPAVMEPIPVLSSSQTKPYMDYRTITSRSSQQWQLIHDSGRIHVAESGFLVDAEGCLGVALGSYFGAIGSRYIFELDSGVQLRVIKLDEKAPQHTLPGGFAALDGSVLELVIDSEKMSEHTAQNGLIRSGDFNNHPTLHGRIERIWRIL